MGQARGRAPWHMYSLIARGCLVYLQEFIVAGLRSGASPAPAPAPAAAGRRLLAAHGAQIRSLGQVPVGLRP